MPAKNAYAREGDNWQRAPRALVVEDDPAWQQILAELLTDAGLAVDLADSAIAASACLRAAPHRLAIVDLSLGGSDHRNQDGLEVLEAVRRYDPGCTALLLSGYATVEIAVSALTRQGAFTCLRKETFRRAHFREVLRQALSAAPAHAQAFAGGAAPAEVDSSVQAAAGIYSGHSPDPGASVPHDSAGSPAGSQPLDEMRHSSSSVASLAPGQDASAGLALIVEDDAGWRSILSELMAEAGFQVHACRSFGEALGHLRRGGYSLAIVDLSLASSLVPHDNTDGLRLLVAIKRAGIPSVVVSGSAALVDIEAAYADHGIVAFLEKRLFDRDAFRKAIQQAITSPTTNRHDLTDREQQVLRLLAQGLSNREIANALVISENTVKRHLKAIFAKLGVSTRAAAAAMAVSVGMGG